MVHSDKSILCFTGFTEDVWSMHGARAKHPHVVTRSVTNLILINFFSEATLSFVCNFYLSIVFAERHEFVSLSHILLLTLSVSQSHILHRISHYYVVHMIFCLVCMAVSVVGIAFRHKYKHVIKIDNNICINFVCLGILMLTIKPIDQESQKTWKTKTFAKLWFQKIY